MKHIAKIGPMYLLKIISITENWNLDSKIYNINFGDCKLAVTAYHAFSLIDGSVKGTTAMVPGDKIWVDLSAFIADGSFTKRRYSSRGI